MNNNDKVVKLVEEWAKRFEENVLDGIVQLIDAYKDDRKMSKSLLHIIALQYPQYADAIVSYLEVYFYVAQKEKENEQIPFDLIQELTYTKLTTISLLLRLGESNEAMRYIGEIAEDLLDFIHKMEITVTKNQGPAMGNLGENVQKSIKASEKHLDRLGDFIIVEDQDKILKEMIAFKRTLSALEERIHEFIVGKF